MSVSDGQPVNAAVSNAAFMSRTQDTNTTGKVDLENTATESGPSVTNAQKSLNGQASFSGASANGAKDQKPSWVDSSVGSAGDDLKDRAEALTTAVTANSSDIASINAQKGVELPLWVKSTVDFSDVSAASLSDTEIVLTLPSAGVIHQIVVKPTTAFTGGTVTDVRLDLGIAAQPDRYFNDVDIFNTPSGTDFEVLQLSEIFDFDNPQDIQAVITATGDNLDQLTQGTVDIYFLTATLSF